MGYPVRLSVSCTIITKHSSSQPKMRSSQSQVGLELRPKKPAEKTCPTTVGSECEFCKKPLLFDRLEARTAAVSRIRMPCQMDNCPAESMVASAVAA